MHKSFCLTKINTLNEKNVKTFEIEAKLGKISALLLSYIVCADNNVDIPDILVRTFTL